MKKKNVSNETPENKLHFYEIMKYPIPIQKEYFYYHPQISTKNQNQPHISEIFSWDKKPPLVSEFLAFIKKWNWLYSQFPFVKEIFLANSITFNALKSSSDIDLFVITSKNRIRIARFIMSSIMTCLRIKRNQKSEYKKFCLSFYVDEENIQLKNLMLNDQDIYLPYWIAHLVPLYQEQRNNTIFNKNNWITTYLPYFPQQQSIFLGNNLITGKGILKRFVEYICEGTIGNILEKGIKKIRSQYIKKKIQKDPERHSGVIIDEGILKFHHDKRKEYSEMFFGKNN